MQANGEITVDMKRKQRKFSNGFYPSSAYDTDTEEMADRACDNLKTDSNNDIVSRLSQLLETVSSNPKLFTTDKHGEMTAELRKEISEEHSALTDLLSKVEIVAIYKVADWSKAKIEAELVHYKVQYLLSIKISYDALCNKYFL